MPPSPRGIGSSGYTAPRAARSTRLIFVGSTGIATLPSPASFRHYLAAPADRMRDSPNSFSCHGPASPTKCGSSIFGENPDTGVSGVLNPTATAKKVDDGFVITGEWHYNSGGWHARWAVLGMPIVNELGATIDQGLALIPMSDLERVDTRFVAGMRSSGSICLKARNVFIRTTHIVGSSRDQGDYPTEMRSQEAFYRSAFVPVLAIILFVQLGLGRAALGFVRQKAGYRQSPIHSSKSRTARWLSNYRSRKQR